MGQRDSLGKAVSATDGYIERHHSDSLVLVNQNARWRKADPSEAQLGLLKKFGVNETVIKQLEDKGQASRLINKLVSQKGKRR